MYKEKYVTKIKRDYKGKRKEISRLVAKFKFNKEAALKGKTEVRERVKEIKKESKYKLHESLFGLNFELCCYTWEKKPFPKESSLDALDNYILTGKGRDKLTDLLFH